MSGIFIRIVNLAISAGWMVLVVLMLRLLFKKAPKWVNPLLWCVVGVRLLFPFSIESIFSLIPNPETIGQDIMYQTEPAVQSGIPALNSVVNPVIQESFAPAAGVSVNPLQIWIPVLAVIWIAGMCGMLFYMILSQRRITKRVADAVLLKENIYQSEKVISPFLLGFFRPKIYLPYGIAQEEARYLIAHEQAHLRRKDHLIKPIGFLILSVYWFHPLLWAAYILLCRDIELACDEAVVEDLSREERAGYSEELLAYSVSEKMISACPVAFGEVGVKERVKHVLTYKKPAFWVLAAAVVISVLFAVCFLTDPLKPTTGNILDEDGYRVLSQKTEEITLTIPKTAITDKCYTEEGQDYKENEVIVFQSKTTNVCLTRVQVSNETKDKLYFMFECFYDLPEKGTFLSLLQKNEDGSYSNTLYMGRQKLFVDDAVNNEWGAVNVRGQGPGQQFALYVSADVCKEAKESLKIGVGLGSVSYASEKSIKKAEKNGDSVFGKLTLDDVIKISEKGGDISWEDFEDYEYTQGITGHFSRHYVIDDLFEVWAGGQNNLYEGELYYAYLRVNDGTDATLDLMTGDVEAFIEEHKNNPVVKQVTAGYFVSPVGYSKEAYDTFVELSQEASESLDSVRALPVVKINSTVKLREFENKMEGLFDLNRGLSYNEQKAQESFDVPFFRDNTLFFVYVGGTSVSNSYNLEFVKKSGADAAIGVWEYRISDETDDGYLLAVTVPNDQIKEIEDFNACISSVTSPEDNTGNPIESYEFKGGGDFGNPTITLFDNGKFTMTYSVVSSYFGYGHYEWSDDGLTLWTEDGRYTHSFYKKDGNLIFDGNHSSEMPEISGVVNGSLFEKME